MGKKLGSSITGVNDALRLCVGDPGPDVAALVSLVQLLILACAAPARRKAPIKRASAYKPPCDPWFPYGADFLE